MIHISVFSRAHRALRHTPRFQFVSKETQLTERYRDQLSATQSPGDVIGIYRNPDPVQPEAILVAENGVLIVRPNASQWIKFSDVASIRAPGAESDSSDILITLRSGIVVSLRVAGRDTRFRDIFSFVR